MVYLPVLSTTNTDSHFSSINSTEFYKLFNLSLVNHYVLELYLQLTQQENDPTRLVGLDRLFPLHKILNVHHELVLRI